MADQWRARSLHTCPNGERAFGQDGHLGILNNSEGTIEIRSIWLANASGNQGFDAPSSPTTGVSRYRITRCSAMSGGEAVNPSKMDTDSADLPSQVLIRLKPEATFGDYIRFVGDTPGVPQAAVVMTSWNTYASKGQNSATFFDSTADVGVQPVVLREGQGLVIADSPNQTLAHLQMGEFIIRVSGTGATYSIFTDRMCTRENGAEVPALGVFNGSGSGVVLEVYQIFSPDIGNSDLNISGQNVRISHLDTIADGEDVMPVANDTDDSLPAGITIRKNFTMRPPRPGLTDNELTDVSSATNMINVSASNLFAILGAYYRSGLIRHVARGPWFPITPFNMETTSGGRNLYYAGPGQTGIVLRKGQGIGIASCSWTNASILVFLLSTYSNLDIAVEFTYTAPAASGGGGGSFTFVG